MSARLSLSINDSLNRGGTGGGVGWEVSVCNRRDWVTR